MKDLVPNSTQIPNIILDEWMADLEGAELKVVLYIARRTFGFWKQSDTISAGQIASGITKKNGEVLDKGTGLSIRGVRDACHYLVECGILLREVSETQSAASVYAINLNWQGAIIDRKAWRERDKTLQPRQSLPGGGATVAGGGVQRLQGGGATVAPTINSIQKEVLQKNPPSPPKGGVAGEGKHGEEEEKAATRSPLMLRFDRWYSAYPKKKSRGDAEKVWGRLKPNEDTLCDMLAALEWQKDSPEWRKDGGQYIPYPATYLGAAAWRDEPPEKAVSPPAASLPKRMYRLEDDPDYQRRYGPAAQGANQ